MHTTLVVAHHRSDSLIHRLAQTFGRGLRDAGHSSTTLDLYTEKFDPVLGGDELNTREGMEDVQRHQALLRHSQGLVLLYPVWWAGMPAILQGWLQRVLKQGFAFDYIAAQRRGLLQHKVHLIINCGTPDRSLKDTLLNPVNYILNFCGVEQLSSSINWGIGPDTPLPQIQAAIDTAYASGKTFFRPIHPSQRGTRYME